MLSAAAFVGGVMGCELGLALNGTQSIIMPRSPTEKRREIVKMQITAGAFNLEVDIIAYIYQDITIYISQGDFSLNEDGNNREPYRFVFPESELNNSTAVMGPVTGIDVVPDNLVVVPYGNYMNLVSVRSDGIMTPMSPADVTGSAQISFMLLVPQN